MKTLSDYKDDEAIELWAELLDPITAIISDKELISGLKGKPPIIMAKEILKSHKAEATQVLLTIDPEPLDGMNILIRFVALLSDIGRNKDIMDFFGSAAQGMTESASSGSATENTEDGVQ